MASTRVLTGRILLADQTPAQGEVIIRPTVPLTAASIGLVTTFPVRQTLDALGQFAIGLLPTDAPDIEPVGWAYTIDIAVPGAHRSITIEVPAGDTPLSLDTVAPAAPGPPVITYVLASAVGHPGGPAGPLDQDGLLPASQVPGGGGGGGGSPATTVASSTTFGQTPAVGSSTLYARGDHVHGTPALGTTASTAAAGNHLHAGVYDAAGAASGAVSAHATASDPHGDRAAASSALAAHTSATTSVHGIADTGALETTSGALAKVAAHGGATDPHGDRLYADQGDSLRLAKSANLSDLANSATARGNLGLGGAATLSVGTTAGTVAAGDDARLTGAVPKSTATAKGDLLVASGAGTITRLGAGSNGQALTADSSQATGLKWATPSGGSSGMDQLYPLAGYGLLAASMDPMAAQMGGSVGSGTVWITRVWVAAGTAITSLWAGVRVAGTWDGSSTPNQLAVYDDGGAQLGTTANDSTLWTGVGWRGGALTGGPVAAQGSGRFVYIAWIVRGISSLTVPFPAAANDLNGSFAATGPTNNHRRAMYVNGASSLPSSFDPATYGTASGYLSMVGIS